MIGTSGLRILVDNQVDYGKNRNMALTSVIFVTGLSGVTLSLGKRIALRYDACRHRRHADEPAVLCI